MGRRHGQQRDLGSCKIAACRAAAAVATRCSPDGQNSIDFEVTPWAGDVQPRPIFAVSDSTGSGARRLAECAWAQFGSCEAAKLTVHPEVRSCADVRSVVEAACAVGSSANSTGGAGTLVIFTLASPALCTQMVRECGERNVPCIDALQPLLAALEAALGQPRLGSGAGSAAASDRSQRATQLSPPPRIFAVSDSSGTSTFELVRSALRQFPGCGVEEVTICPRVRSLEEIRLVAQEAGRADAVVAFTFASTGMSRFMRQRCEAVGALSADLYQPVLLAMEIYLEYPAIGVPGGYSEAPAATQQKWEQRTV